MDVGMQFRNLIVANEQGGSYDPVLFLHFGPEDVPMTDAEQAELLAIVREACPESVDPAGKVDAAFNFWHISPASRGEFFYRKVTWTQVNRGTAAEVIAFFRRYYSTGVYARRRPSAGRSGGWSV